MNRVRRTRPLADALRARVALIGVDPQDDEDTRASKTLLVLISVLILPIAVLWGVLYLAFGSPVGFVPLVYAVVLLGAIGVFSRTRDFAQLLRVNLLDILFAPTLSMIPLGGFLDSGGVGLWGVLAPLGALVFSDVRAAARWYAAYVVIFLSSGIAGEVLGGISPAPPRWFTTTMLALNVVVGGTIVFTLLALFAEQRRDAVSALRSEQAKSENLLLNILPRSIAEQLKAQTQPIADQFNSASILFADVVDFTPWSERRAPAEVVGILDQLFSHFDTLAERYGLEKIKTIGDCYMAAAGVPTPRHDMRGLWRRWRSTCSTRCARAMTSVISGWNFAWDQLGACRGRRDRPKTVPLRSVGRRRQHGQSHGIARDVGSDPDHSGDLRTAGGRLRVPAEGNHRRQGQGRDGGLVSRPSTAEPRRGPAQLDRECRIRQRIVRPSGHEPSASPRPLTGGLRQQRMHAARSSARSRTTHSRSDTSLAPGAQF